MTREEWLRKLMIKLASGHMNVNTMNEAKDWLAGKEPPVDVDWKPSAKKAFDNR